MAQWRIKGSCWTHTISPPEDLVVQLRQQRYIVGTRQGRAKGRAERREDQSIREEGKGKAATAAKGRDKEEKEK